MKKYFSLEKYKINYYQPKLKYFNIFFPKKEQFHAFRNILKFSSYEKNKAKKTEILPKLNLEYKNNVNNNLHNIKLLKEKEKNNNMGAVKKQKSKFNIPINKIPSKNYNNLNQKYVININNNINNSYELKMQNNNESKKSKYIAKCKGKIHNIDRVKIIQSNEQNKNVSINNSNQKTILSEISDLSCFKSSDKNKKLNNENKDVDIFDLSEDNEKEKSLLWNAKNADLNKNNQKITKKIYINPLDFKIFCKKVEEKLNI